MSWETKSCLILQSTATCQRYGIKQFKIAYFFQGLIAYIQLFILKYNWLLIHVLNSWQLCFLIHLPPKILLNLPLKCSQGKALLKSKQSILCLKKSLQQYEIVEGGQYERIGLLQPRPFFHLVHVLKFQFCVRDWLDTEEGWLDTDEWAPGEGKLKTDLEEGISNLGEPVTTGR